MGNKLNLIFDMVITDNSNYLDKIRKIPKLKENSKVVYIYSYIDNTINYPFKNGKIIYIGKAHRQKDSTAKRFSQHFSENDTGSNRALINIKDSNKKIRLQIFQIKDLNESEVEMMLFQWHIKEFGALPIAISAGGKNFMKRITDQLEFHEIENIIKEFL